MSEIEEMIKKLPGIISCRVVVNNWGGIEEIHVLAGEGRSPKQIVRDIESLLHAQWNLSVDHKKISIAKLSSPEFQTLERRVFVKRIGVFTEPGVNRCQIRVEIGDRAVKEKDYAGESAGLKSQSGLMRTATKACIEAVGAMFPDDEVRFAVEDVTAVEMGGKRLVVVLLEWTNRGGESEYLSGVALESSDVVEAAIKATLSALNRRLSRLLTESSGDNRPVSQGAE